MTETVIASKIYPGNPRPPQSQRSEFPNDPGEMLTARLDLSAARLSAGLAAEGIAVPRFDFTGLGGRRRKRVRGW
ncbi:MAG: hypothetical protein IIC64_01950 [SAR324 cluster bacterium]|nr:hypothetical protein [SAR324 cluster bacterium]